MPYLNLIAVANELADPLDPRVVEAYWVGNGLLDRVRPEDLARHVEERFRGRIGCAWEQVLDAVAGGAVPHHAFHVFAVYPWLGLLRTGVVDPPLRVLDQCRTTPARVESASGDRARVLARRLDRDGGTLTARGLGDWVSLHWDFVCDRLAPSAARRLGRVTRRILASVNATPSTAPALG